MSEKLLSNEIKKENLLPAIEELKAALVKVRHVYVTVSLAVMRHHDGEITTEFRGYTEGTGAISACELDEVVNHLNQMSVVAKLRKDADYLRNRACELDLKAAELEGK